MTDNDYWGATGADLPRVRPTDDAGEASGAPGADAAGPGGEAGEPLFRTTARLPRVDPVAPAGATAEPWASDTAPPAAAPAVPADGPLADPPAEHQHRLLALVLVLAVAAVGGLVGWRLLTQPGGLGTAVPAPTTASASPAPAPAPTTTTRTPVPVVEPTIAYGPPPPPLHSAAPVRTITQTVLVRVPAPHEVTTTPPGPPTPTTPAPTTTLTPLPIADWRFDPTGVGPITLGMPVAVAAQEGFLVPEPSAAEGFVTSPALSGVELWLEGGHVSGVVITDPAVRSAEGLGVGTPLADLHRLFGDALVMVTLRDAAGLTRPLPGLEFPTTYLAFVPGEEPPTASPAPGATASPSPGTPTPTDSATATGPPTPSPAPTTTPTTPTMSTPTPTPTPTGTVAAVIVALKQPGVANPSAAAPTTPAGATGP